MFLSFEFPLFKEFAFGVGGAFDPVRKLGVGSDFWVVSDPIFRLGGRCLGHGTEPQSSVRTASESVSAYGGAKATRVAEDGYGADRIRRILLLGYRGTFGVLSRRERMWAGNIHCVLFLGFCNLLLSIARFPKGDPAIL